MPVFTKISKGIGDHPTAQQLRSQYGKLPGVNLDNLTDEQVLAAYNKYLAPKKTAPVTGGIQLMLASTDPQGNKVTGISNTGVTGVSPSYVQTNADKYPLSNAVEKISKGEEVKTDDLATNIYNWIQDFGKAEVNPYAPKGYYANGTPWPASGAVEKDYTPEEILTTLYTLGSSTAAKTAVKEGVGIADDIIGGLITKVKPLTNPIAKAYMNPIIKKELANPLLNAVRQAATPNNLINSYFAAQSITNTPDLAAKQYEAAMSGDITGQIVGGVNLGLNSLMTFPMWEGIANEVTKLPVYKINPWAVKRGSHPFYTTKSFSPEVAEYIKTQKVVPNELNEFSNIPAKLKPGENVLGIGYDGTTAFKSEIATNEAGNATGITASDIRAKTIGSSAILSEPSITGTIHDPAMYQLHWLKGIKKTPFKAYQEGEDLTAGISQHYADLNKYLENKVPGLKVYGSAKLAEKGIGTKLPGDIDAFYLTSSKGAAPAAMKSSLNPSLGYGGIKNSNSSTIEFHPEDLKIGVDVNPFRNDAIGAFEAQMLFYKEPKLFKAYSNILKRNKRSLSTFEKDLNMVSGSDDMMSADELVKKIKNQSSGIVKKNVENYNSADFGELSMYDKFNSSKDKQIIKASELEESLEPEKATKIYTDLMNSLSPSEKIYKKINIPEATHFSDVEKNKELLKTIGEDEELATNPEKVRLLYTKYVYNEGLFQRGAPDYFQGAKKYPRYKSGPEMLRKRQTTLNTEMPAGGAYNHGIYASKGLGSVGYGTTGYATITPFDLSGDPYEIVKVLKKSQINYYEPMNPENNPAMYKILKKALGGDVTPRKLSEWIEGLTISGKAKSTNVRFQYPTILKSMGYDVVTNVPGENYVLTTPGQLTRLSNIEGASQDWVQMNSQLGFLQSLSKRAKNQYADPYGLGNATKYTVSNFKNLITDLKYNSKHLPKKLYDKYWGGTGVDGLRKKLGTTIVGLSTTAAGLFGKYLYDEASDPRFSQSGKNSLLFKMKNAGLIDDYYHTEKGVKWEDKHDSIYEKYKDQLNSMNSAEFTNYINSQNKK